MPRSLKKPPYIAAHLVEKIVAMRASLDKRPIKTDSRASTIVPEMEGLTFLVHNGRSYDRVDINKDKVGHKLGEFALTRTPPRHKAMDKKAKGVKR